MSDQQKESLKAYRDKLFASQQTHAENLRKTPTMQSLKGAKVSKLVYRKEVR
jgi:hypothetical protein